MAKKKQTPKRADSKTSPQEKKAGKRFPSRDNVKYVALPKELHEWLERFAEERSQPYDRKSVAWAARQAVFWFKMHIEQKDADTDSAGPAENSTT